MDKILKDKKAIFIFIAPALLMFVLVLVIPICQMLYYSLCDYAALTPPKFVGLANYKKLFLEIQNENDIKNRRNALRRMFESG